MKSRKTLFLLSVIANIVAIFFLVAFLVAPHLKTAEMRKEADNPWIPTAKDTFKYPYESFVQANYKTPKDAVCIGDQPCIMPPAGTPEHIARAVASWERFPQDAWEDTTSKPWQVMGFMGIKPGDKIVDLLPGDRHIVSMYWSRLFYHAVGEDGRVFVFIPMVGCRFTTCSPENYKSSSNGYGIRPVYTLLGNNRFNGIDEALDVEHLMAYRNLYTMWDVAGQFAIPQQADIVWSTGHWHALHGEVYNLDMTDFLPRLFQGMANGSSLVIADYASKPGAGWTQVDTLHRVDKEAVKTELIKYGFVFDGESNLWAKSDDDHTKVVPEEATPGTADMFILKFKKPMNAPPSDRPSREEMASWLDTNYTGSGTMAHGQTGGGGTWHGANYMGTEWQGPGGGIVKSWYMNAQGALCERQEWDPMTFGLIGCHYERERIVKAKLGDTWEQRPESANDDPNATCHGCTVYRRGLSPWHTFVPRPTDCETIFSSCSSYNVGDNLAKGHMR